LIGVSPGWLGAVSKRIAVLAETPVETLCLRQHAV
jgi:hypothetical protein